MVEQGDMITVRGIAFPLLVVSKNEYNKCGSAIVCPILKQQPDITLYEYIESDVLSGYVCCDNMKLLNIDERGAFVKGRVPLVNMMDILGKIQAIFDY